MSRLVNRGVITLEPTQPLVDWVNECDPEGRPMTREEAARDGTAYLVPNCDSEEEAALFVKRNFLEILEYEWEAWYTDESLWPADPSYEMFCWWFHYRYCSVVCDLSAEPLVRERG